MFVLPYFYHILIIFTTTYVVLTDIGDIIVTNMGYISVGKCTHIEINRRFNLIHEREWTGGDSI